MGYTVGIDLGTMYSAAAVQRDGRVEAFGLGATAPVVPSVVVLREDGEILTGETAERRSITEPLRTAREFKRRLGDPVPVILGGTPYGAEALMAHLLRAIVAAVTEREGEPPSLVALTHPANYTAYKLGLLQEAALGAGLDLSVVRFVSEPEAAAISYAHQQRVEPGEIVAIYDFGGGTFDAAVVRRTETGFELIGTPQGMDRLGGIDIDHAVLAHVDQSLDGMLGQLDADDPAMRAGLARLRDDVRLAKEALSTDTDTTVLVSLPGLQTEVRLTREELEGMIRPRIRETVEALDRAVTSAGVQMSDVTRILLIGGSSRIPLVGQLVRELTGRPVAADAHPKLSVATGAALAVAVDQPDSAAAPATEAVAPSTVVDAEGLALARGAGAAAVAGGLTAAGLAAGTGLAAATSSGPDVAVAAAPPAQLVSGTTQPPAAALPPAPSEATSAPVATATTVKSGRSKVPIIVGSVVGVVAAVGAFAVIRSSSDGASPAPSTTSAASAEPGGNAASGAATTGRGLTGIVTTVAGNGSSDGLGVPGPSTSASLGRAGQIAATPNGDVYLSDRDGRVLKVSAGQVTIAYDANGTAPNFYGVAVKKDGSVLFGNDLGIQKLEPGGGATLLVAAAQVGDGYTIAVGPDDTVYVATTNHSVVPQVLRIEGSNAVPIAGVEPAAGATTGTGDGGPAKAATFVSLDDIAVGPDGTVYVADSLDHRVRRIATDGTITTVAGGGSTEVSHLGSVAPEGTPATNLLLDEPQSVAVDGNGLLYVADQNAGVIFRIDATGGMEAVITGYGGVTEQEGKAAQATLLSSAGSISFGGRSLYFMDMSNLRQVADAAA